MIWRGCFWQAFVQVTKILSLSAHGSKVKGNFSFGGPNGLPISSVRREISSTPAQSYIICLHSSLGSPDSFKLVF